MRAGWMWIPLLVACEGTTDPSEKSAERWIAPCPLGESEQRLVEVQGIQLNVACRGAGPTVLLLHGFPEWHRGWKDVMDALEDQYRLIAPDQRGYNLSDKPADVSAYRLETLVEDMVQLLDHVTDEPALVVAHDWGGPVGWALAHSEQARIRGILSTNGPHPFRFTELLENDPEQQAASAYIDLFRAEDAEVIFTPESLVDTTFGHLDEAEQALYLEALSQPGAITGGLNWYRANALTEASTAASMAGFAETVLVPATVLWGEDDTAVLVSNAEGLEPWVPDLQVEIFPGVDHWINHRIPDEIARAVRELDTRAP